MTLAAETIPGTDPDRASFTTALHAAINTLASPDVLPGSQPAGRIGQAVLAALLPPAPPPGSASARSNPRSPAGTGPPPAGPPAAPP